MTLIFPLGKRWLYITGSSSESLWEKNGRFFFCRKYLSGHNDEDRYIPRWDEYFISLN